MPGVGPCVAAALLTETAGALHSRNYEMLRALSGVAPVTEASGKRSGRRARVRIRRACRRRLRNAVHYWAGVALQHDLSAKAHYQTLRGKGGSYGRALRGVADRLLRILLGALRTRTLYDAGRLQGTYARVAAASSVALAKG